MEIQLTTKDSITKADINYIANDLIQKLDDGEVSALLLLEKFKSIEKINEAVKEKMIEIGLIELSKYPEKSVELFNSAFTAREAGTKYDFSRVNDSKYFELLEKVENAKKELKKREDFLKAIVGHETCVNEQTSEIETIYPPIKTSSTTVIVSLK